MPSTFFVQDVRNCWLSCSSSANQKGENQVLLAMQDRAAPLSLTLQLRLPQLLLVLRSISCNKRSALGSISYARDARAATPRQLSTDSLALLRRKRTPLVFAPAGNIFSSYAYQSKITNSHSLVNCCTLSPASSLRVDSRQFLMNFSIIEKFLQRLRRNTQSKRILSIQSVYFCIDVRGLPR